MNKVIESFKNSKFSQLLGQPIKSFFSIVNQVDVPGIENEDKYRHSLTNEDRMLDDELLNALKDVKEIEKKKKAFDSIKEKNHFFSLTIPPKKSYPCRIAFVLQTI